MGQIEDKWFYLAIFVMGGYFIYRLIDQSQMISQLPFDNVNDYMAHFAQLFFLAKYGFHQFVPHWYNGFILFLHYPPGWYFFTLPLYILTKNVLLSTYLSLIAMFFIIFVSLFIFGKTQKFSIIKRIAFFLFLMTNSICIGNYIRLGRVSEFFSLMCFVILATLLLYYRNKDIDWKFYILFIPSYFFLIISHPAITIIFHILWLSFFIVKSFKEKILFIISSLIAVIATSFWWYPFLTTLSSESNRLSFPMTARLLEIFSGPWVFTNIASFIIGTALGITFFFYWKTFRYSKKELLFFSPILILGFLFITRLIIFVPFLNRVYPDVYMFFFLFFAIFFLLKINTRVLGKFFTFIFILGLILLPLSSVFISEIHTPKFIPHGPLEDEFVEILPYVDNMFVISHVENKTSHVSPIYTYGIIYHNLSTPAGGINFGTPSVEYYDSVQNDFKTYLKAKDCQGLEDTMRFFNTTDIITYTFTGDCETLQTCNLTEVRTQEMICLYRLED
ncbi:MAG: hypothetical protein ABIJ18_01930 [archaeon]